MNGRPWRQRWRHSLRARLITVFAVLALLMGVVFIGGMQRALSAGWRDALRPLVTDYIDRLAADIGSPPDIARAQALTQSLPLSIRIEGPTVNWASNPQGDGRRRGGFALGRAEWLARTTADGHRIAFGLSPPSFHEQAPGLAGLVTLLLMLLLMASAYRYVRRLLRPLDDIRAGAARFGQGRFDEPIPVRRHDELGVLASDVNTMAGDIARMLDAKRGLLLAISHELRSPLTRARLNAELLPQDGAGATERQALLRDLAVMRDLVADLLESERLASPHAPLHREAVQPAELAREVLSEHHSREARAIELRVPSDMRSLLLDRVRVKLLLRNLVDNAVRHGGHAAQAPVLTLSMAHGVLHVDMRDFGPGVAEDELPHLGEAFHRPDGARQRATGGVGLGMYLSRLVAEAHGGRLVVSNAHPGLRVHATLT